MMSLRDAANNLGVLFSLVIRYFASDPAEG